MANNLNSWCALQGNNILYISCVVQDKIWILITINCRKEESKWCKIVCHKLIVLQKNKEIALHVPSITKYHEFYVPTYQDFEAPFRVAEIIYALEDSFFEDNGDMVKGEHNHVEFSNNVWIWQVTI